MSEKNKLKNTEIKDNKLDCFKFKILNKNESKIDISVDDIKILLENSVVSLFGVIEAKKTLYSIKFIEKDNYEIICNKKSSKILKTSLILINDSDLVIRVKIEDY